jgi:hypothetical protein
VISSPVFQVWNEDGSTGLSVLEATAGWAISDVRCDVGSLTLTVVQEVDGRQVAGVSDLLVDADRQIRVLQQGAPDMWFVLDDDGWAGVSDAPASEPRSLACRSLAVVADEVHLTTDAAYSSASPGAIVADTFIAGQGRGFLQGITLTGGASADADGDAWPDAVTVTYKTGTSLLAILKGLSDAGLLEWRMNARALEIYKPGGGLDRELDRLLRPGADVTGAPIQRSRKAVTTDALVVDSDGAATTRSQSLTGRRRREVVVQQPADSDAATVGDLYLSTHASSQVQLSHDVTDGPDSPLPWVDYRPGDRILTVAAGGGAQSWRIQQVAMAAQQGGQITVGLELGAILKSPDEQFADALAHLQPGAVVLTS